MSINRKEIEELADLAKLKLSKTQASEVGVAMNDIKQMIDLMNEADVTGIEPMFHPMDAVQRLRSDQVTDQSHQRALLSLSAHADNEHYLVPKVIE